MGWLALIAAAAGAFVLSWLGTAGAFKMLRRRAVLDHPNVRSSHASPTPRGAGLAVLGAIAVVWVAIAAVGTAPTALPVILLAACALAVVSWRDDLRGLSVAARLPAHTLAVIAGLSVLPAEALVFQGVLPPLADRAATGLLWLWFVNLYNFMDGIDGIVGVETAAIALGVCVIAAGAPQAVGMASLSAALGAAALGFLWWNWHPARIFLGDVGSIPLGYLAAWLLIELAAAGHWPAALVLPLYFLADATLTLARRLARGERVWHAHASHFYQRAARRLGNHARVVRAVALANAGLVAVALTIAPGGPLAPAPGLFLAAALCAVLLWYLGRGSPGLPAPPPRR